MAWVERMTALGWLSVQPNEALEVSPDTIEYVRMRLAEKALRSDEPPAHGEEDGPPRATWIRCPRVGRTAPENQYRFPGQKLLLQRHGRSQDDKRKV